MGKNKRILYLLLLAVVFFSMLLIAPVSANDEPASYNSSINTSVTTGETGGLAETVSGTRADASGVSLSSSILPALSIEITPGSIYFGQLSAGESSDVHSLSVRNKGALDARITVDVMDVAGNLFVEGINLDSGIWSKYSRLVKSKQTVNTEVMLEVPEDYIGIGSMEGKLVFWAEMGKNRAPVLAAIGDRTVNSSETLQIILHASDADGDDLIYSTDAWFGVLEENIFTWNTSGFAPGDYMISFSVSDGYYSDSERIRITLNDKQVTDPNDGNPFADFISNTTSGKAPLTVIFTDMSVNASYWEWDFGDGISSEDRNPVHTYLLPGNYSVSLTAGNSYGNDTKTKADYVNVLQSINVTLQSPSSSSVADYAGSSRTFTVSTNETANVTWILDGATLHTNHSITTASCYFASAVEGVHKLTAIAENLNGAGSNGWTWTVVEKSSSGSSSSSGGRLLTGGGSSGEDYGNILFKEAASQNVIAKRVTTYMFYYDGNPVTSISFKALKNSGIVSATVEVLKGRSGLVLYSPPGIVYQYVNIWVGDTGFAEPENIENAVVTFKVSKSWIENNSMAESSVSMYRYNGEWAGLPTRKVKEDNEYVYFEAKTPGFSPFAITGTTRELAPAGESPLMSPGDNAESGTTVASASAVEISEPVKSGSWLWLLLALLLAICAGAYVCVRKGVISPGRKKFENVVLKEVQTMPVSAGTIVSYVYENEENPVRYVNFEAGKDLGDLEIKVEVLREKSRLVRDMPSGIVYRHINIWAGKSDFPGLTDIAEPVVGFQVDKSWIEEKGLDESGIRLLRYEDGVWQDMVTELADTDEGYLVFESKVSGFAAFAISGIKDLSSLKK